MSSSLPHTLSREVQITRTEFMRQLPDAIGQRTFKEKGDRIEIQHESGSIGIKLADRGIRQMGSLELPILGVDFSFEGLSPAQIDAFFERYDTHELRVGGM